jgi:hypothetical protein
MTDLKTALWCDLTTDEERSAWLLLGRGHETGVVAKSMQNDLARAYQRLSTPECVCGEPNTAGVHRQDGPCYQQPEQKPVAWLDSLDRSQPHAVTGFQYLSVSQIERGDQHKYIPVYAAPQQREWQGLTDEEVDEAAKERWVAKQSFEAGAWWANEKLREKNK